MVRRQLARTFREQKKDTSGRICYNTSSNPGEVLSHKHRGMLPLPGRVLAELLLTSRGIPALKAHNLAFLCQPQDHDQSKKQSTITELIWKKDRRKRIARSGIRTQVLHHIGLYCGLPDRSPVRTCVLGVPWPSAQSSEVHALNHYANRAVVCCWKRDTKT